jgi:hypothetical protein
MKRFLNCQRMNAGMLVFLHNEYFSFNKGKDLAFCLI